MAATFALLCLIWGTTWSVIQIGLSGVPPFSGIAIRFASASVLLLCVARILRVRLGATRVERRLWLVNGLLAFSVSYGVVYWAEQWIPSSLVAVLFSTYPLFVALFAHLALPEEAVRRAEAVGVAAAFAGVAVIFSEDLTALGGPRAAMAAAITLLAPIASAAASVAVKRWGGEVHPLSITAVPMGIAAGVMAGLALAFERHRSFTWSSVSVGALIYLSLAGSAVTFSLYYWLLTHLPAKRMALIAYVVPVVAVAIGVVRGEPLTARILVGAALVIGAVALAIQSGSGGVTRVARSAESSRPRPAGRP